MRQSLRNQIFLPFGLLAVVATAAIASATAFLTVKSRQVETLKRLGSVVETLRSSRFPFTPAVLNQMHGLSAADCVVRSDHGSVVASTVPVPAGEQIPETSVTILDQLTEVPSIRIAGVEYFAAQLPLSGVHNGQTLLVLLPVQEWRNLGWNAAWPPLAAGAAASLVVLMVAGWIAGRLTRRLDAIRKQVMQIADGTADRLSLDGPDDELHDLAGAVNTVSDQLRLHERTIRQTERMRLVAQLSSGLAHQLRNAASGARLAVQLVRRRHPSVADKELGVALTQLEIIEDHIRRLLAVGSERQTAARPGTVSTLFQSVEELVSPVSRHSGVQSGFEAGASASTGISDLEAVRSILTNLVMNGMEAAGRGGAVQVLARPTTGGQVAIEVSDTGPGPDPEIADRIFEPFVTSRQEGVGLGLAYVRRTIEQLGGTVNWTRESDRTCFRLHLPVVAVDAASISPLQAESQSDRNQVLA